MKKFLLFLFIIILFSSPIWSWSGKTHQRIAENALKYMPKEFQRRIMPYKNEILEGSIAPDRVYRDFQNHIYDFERRKGGGIEKVREKYYHVISLIRDKKPWRLIAYELGILSHYIADLNQPLHTSSSYEEKEFHSKFEKDAEQIVPRRIKGLNFISKPAYYIFSSARSAHLYYYDIEKAYTNNKGWKAVSSLTQKQIDKSVEDVANYWYSIWVRANRVPTLGDLWNDFLDFLFLYINKIFAVEVK
ncbi:MAG: zinc dependent phospholipase C family protein [Dictyoglomus sp.]|nr:zinc dependent phospholipase C family protein [Dictyoglomus sp.]MDW8189237.1 zinc dependent phospholipase C family protein [Dictyoglomus sp.]